MEPSQIKENDLMPTSKNLVDCTGCSGCAAICPESCITMAPNFEGFLYPEVDILRCTNCGLCRKICPVNAKKRENEDLDESKPKPLAVYAAWHLDDNIRKASSSGGVFTAFAETILDKGGAVVGAALDDKLNVKHIIIESSNELGLLRGSKYVQSAIDSTTYKKILDLLNSGRYVLFSGTPCQVAGLKSFLRKPYDKLLCIDLICMGVPSPKLFKKYADWKCKQIGKDLISCEFRNKACGWKIPSMTLGFSDESNICQQSAANPYWLAFGMKIALRQSCYACCFKGINRLGDLTIADFWGVGNKYPEYDIDDKGTSLVLVNNENGMLLLNACNSILFLGSADIQTAIAGNPMLINSCKMPPQRETFYKDLNNKNFILIIKKYNLYRPCLLYSVLLHLRDRIYKTLKLFLKLNFSINNFV
jgi:coenzyme F420-reducing hydrogenase beta subunit